MIGRLPEAHRPALARVALQRVAPDNALSTLAFVHDHFGALDEPTRASILQKLPSDEHRSQAALLFTTTTPAYGQALRTVDGPFDEDWTAAVKKVISEHPIDRIGAEAMLAYPKFDDGRSEVLTLLLPMLPESERPELILDALGLCGFDSGRNTLLRKHQALVLTQPPAVRQAMVDTMKWDKGKEEARGILEL